MVSRNPEKLPSGEVIELDTKRGSKTISCFVISPAAVDVSLPDGGHVTLALPVRNRAKHVWTKWAGIHRNLIAALAAYRQF